MSDNKKQQDEISVSKEDEIFKLLTHQTRRNIIKVLGEQDLSFSQIKRKIEIDSPALSYHLKSIRDFVTQKKSKYSLSDMGRAALFLLTKADQSIKISRYKRNFLYTYLLTYACWVIIGALVPIYVTFLTSTDMYILVIEIWINVIATINMSFIGYLKSRQI